jgi:hypothetical protein
MYVIMKSPKIKIVTWWSREGVRFFYLLKIKFSIQYSFLLFCALSVYIYILVKTNYRVAYWLEHQITFCDIWNIYRKSSNLGEVKHFITVWTYRFGTAESHRHVLWVLIKQKKNSQKNVYIQSYFLRW